MFNENKKEIVLRLKLLLMATRAGNDIKKLVLSEDEEYITIVRENGAEKKVCIAMDSGIALIRDVIKEL